MQTLNASFNNNRIYQENVPCNFAFKVTSIDIYNRYIKCPKPMIPLTIDKEEQFSRVESCHICREPLGVDSLRDHCHILVHYGGVAHNACNLNYRIDHTK